MSYARFGKRSDVYVFFSTAGVFECCSCRLRGEGQCTTTATAEAMLDHLRDHRRAGHKVQRYTLKRLREREVTA